MLESAIVLDFFRRGRRSGSGMLGFRLESIESPLMLDIIFPDLHRNLLALFFSDTHGGSEVLSTGQLSSGVLQFVFHRCERYARAAVFLRFRWLYNFSKLYMHQYMVLEHL